MDVARSNRLAPLGLLFALAMGLAAAWLDSRPHWDDTGITAGLVFLGALTAAALAPRRWLLVALLASVPVGLAGLYAGHSFAAFLAVVPAGLGAAAGTGTRRLAAPLNPIR